MRPVRLTLVPLILFFMVIVEREYPWFPLTWIVLVYFSFQFKIPLLIVFGLTLLIDVAVALPLGWSAIICSGFLTVISFAPKKIQWRALYFVLFGAFLGCVYGVVRHALSPGMILSSSVFCAAVFTIGSNFASIEEIGNAQN